MGEIERAFIIRENRNALLSSLLATFPGSISGETLFRSMLGAFPAYTRTFAVRDLYYLEGKGYVVRKHPLTGRKDPECEWKEARWVLTPAGNEVANKLIHDPALEV